MMKNQLAGLMKQAQAMQDNMKKAQEQLAQIEVEGQSGAGLVKVVMTCKNDVKRVTIDPSLLGDDRDMLEDLVAAAFNDAVRKAEATASEKMSGLTAFGDLLAPHRDVHRKGRDVLVSLTEGREAEASARMADLEQLSHQVIGLLDHLGAEFVERTGIDNAA